MCGIVGVFHPEGRTSSVETLAHMRDAMRHRGPDDEGLWSEREGRCRLGHRRLSIIDLSEAANQPMLDASGQVALAYNGEIYNHAELRRELIERGHRDWKTDHSDTEVLLRAYLEWGLDLLDRVNGMFAFAIYDARNPEKPKLHLVRDPIGIKPLVFSQTIRGEWIWASEIRALVRHPDLKAELEPVALWHYLTFIVSPAPLTMFKNVFKVPPATVITIDHRGEATAHSYWDARPDRVASPADLSETEATEELARVLRTSIERRMVSDVPFGVLLSGGVDSSLNVALMSELMDRPVSTFTIGYEGEEDSNEFQYARQVSKLYGTDHRETLISRESVEAFLPELVAYQDEPIADNVCIPLFFLAKLVKESNCTVVQVGEGADENWLGYWWCDHYRDKFENVYEPARRKRRSWRGLRDRFLAPVSDTSFEDQEIRARATKGQALFWGGATCWWGSLRESLTPQLEPYRSQVRCPVRNLLPASFERLDSHEVVKHYRSRLKSLREPSILAEIPYLELKLRLPEHLLMRVDKMTMAHSIEARVPFLDRDVVEYAMRVPSEYKLEDGVGKKILKQFAATKLPHELVYRRKQGFGAPMESWFQNEAFRKKCRAALDRSPLLREGYIGSAKVDELLSGYEKGVGGYSFHLWTVMNAVLWCEYWVLGREDCF